MYESKAIATATAQKVYNQSSLDNDVMNITTVGNPQLTAGVPITIKGLRDDIPQNWYIKTVAHSISKGGYVSSLTLTLKEL